MVLGTVEHIFFRWHLMERQEELPDFVDSVMEIIMGGIRDPGRSQPPLRLDISLSKAE
jgi:hypothetical protein